MADPDTAQVIGFAIMVLLLFVMVVVGLPRGKRMQQTNEKIEANQRQMMALSERQASAMERIAEALENHG